MPRRELLTESQRLIFNAPVSDERGMVRHYTLSAEDLTLNEQPRSKLRGISKQRQLMIRV